MDIFEIVIRKDVESLKEAIKNGADVNVLRDSAKRTPLHYAAINNDLEIIQLLLNAGAKPTVKDYEDNTPLHYAVAVDDPKVEVIEEFLKEEAINVNETNKLGRTPLHETIIRNGNPKIANKLIEANAKFNVRDSYGKTPLHYAKNSWLTNEVTIEILEIYEAKLDPDVTEEQQQSGLKAIHKTRLHYAAMNNDLKEIKALISAGADINAKDNEGNTPLHYAVAVEKPELKVVQEFLKAKSNIVNATNDLGRTPLHVTLFSNSNPSIVKALIMAKTEFNTRDLGGRTALDIASNNWCSNPNTIKLLQEAGAKSNPDETEEKITLSDENALNYGNTEEKHSQEPELTQLENTNT